MPPDRSEPELVPLAPTLNSSATPACRTAGVALHAGSVSNQREVSAVSAGIAFVAFHASLGAAFGGNGSDGSGLRGRDRGHDGCGCEARAHLRSKVRLRDGSGVITTLEVQWWTTVAGKPGGLRLWVDGAETEFIPLNNGQGRLLEVELGAAGLPTGTAGMLYLDAFESWQ